MGQLSGLYFAHGGVAGPEQRGVEQRESPRGRYTWGPSEARCVPLVRLLLLSDPGSWCGGTRKRLGQLPGLCSAHRGVAGHEQRGMEQRESPLECCKSGPSEARCVPLVRLLLLSDPGSWCTEGADLDPPECPGIMEVSNCTAEGAGRARKLR